MEYEIKDIIVIFLFCAFMLFVWFVFFSPFPSMRTDKMFKELKPGQKMRCNVQEIGNPYSEVVTATITIVSKKEGWVEYYYSDQPEKMRYSKFSTLIDFYNYKLID